jgi:cytochrome c oxidase assembly protein subunit 15
MEKTDRGLTLLLKILAVMIVGLMALGAGVRAMKAGLACPDWPLCFGKIIPDFHPGVWFEFVHRAYAGLVALLFLGVLVRVLVVKQAPRGARMVAGLGAVILVLQIGMGAATVLRLVQWFYVTSHLMLATFFFMSVMWLHFLYRPTVESAAQPAPRLLGLTPGFLSLLVLVQMTLGGVVAATYSGSVCVDWPLCNGQWVPTWTGAIGLQVIHRFVAYSLALGFIAWAIALHMKRDSEWMTPQLLRLSRLGVGVVLLQVAVGVLNLVWFLPVGLTVLHQTGAVVLLAVGLRNYFVARSLALKSRAEYPAARPAPLFETHLASSNSP